MSTFVWDGGTINYRHTCMWNVSGIQFNKGPHSCKHNYAKIWDINWVWFTLFFKKLEKSGVYLIINIIENSNINKKFLSTISKYSSKIYLNQNYLMITNI